MQKIVIGALADVDAGKTTLAEGLLYKSGMIRKKGRVDHKDTFLDFDKIEKEKGITIFNKEAFFKYDNQDFIYIDTPGHKDFKAEQQRALKILDYAILVVSAIEQNLTNTKIIYEELKRNKIKTFIFLNKMDIAKEDDDTILNRLKLDISPNILEVSDLEELLSTGLITNLNQELIDHNIIPLVKGSALKDINIDFLLSTIKNYTTPNTNNNNLNAYIYRYDENGNAIVKVLSGTLLNKTQFDKDNKINEMYQISGNNYTPIQTANQNDIVAIKGLKYDVGTYLPSLEKEVYTTPLNNKVIESKLSSFDLFNKIKQINKQLPELNIQLVDDKVTIYISSPLVEEIFIKLLKDRFNIDVSIAYYVEDPEFIFDDDLPPEEEPIDDTPYVYARQTISNEELNRVFNNTYKQKTRIYTKKEETKEEKKEIVYKEIIYIVDGYNLLHSLKEYREEDFQILRDKVVDMVCDFGGYVNAQCVLVFDAYKTEEKRTRTINHDNITIVYTKNKQTADEYIEIKTKELTKDYKVIVVTSDYLEQLRVFANGANRMSSREFIERYELFKKDYKIEHKPNRPLLELRELLEKFDFD